MSCSEANIEKLDELTNKLNRCNKDIKLVLELLEKMNEPNEKKTQVGYVAKGSSEYKNKKQVYVTKLNNKEIKQPRPETLRYCEIEYDEDEEKYVAK